MNPGGTDRGAGDESTDDGNPGEYCRAIEAYLCRKNEGHLVRIVGPAFDRVCGWASRGVPMRVACRGIDRTVERHQAKGERRRPVRIEFCEADVLDVFDEWRRAVGVPAAGPAGDAPDDAARRHGSLPAHLERVVARLTALRASDLVPLGDIVDPMVAELDAARGTARGLRGEPRRHFLERLRALDATLVSEARARLDAAALAGLQTEAAEELAGFRDRMPGNAYDGALHACVDRLVRERLRLPVVALD